MLVKVIPNLEILLKSKGQRPAPKVKVDLTSSKPKKEKNVPKPNASTNRHGEITLECPYL